MSFRSESLSGSEFSRPSTYSTNLPQGTTLTQADLLKPNTADFTTATFVSTVHGDTPHGELTNVTKLTRGVKFADTIQEKSISRSSSQNSVVSSQPKKARLEPIDLKQRLYKKPEHCQAVMVVRNQEALRKKIQTEDQPPLPSLVSSCNYYLQKKVSTVKNMIFYVFASGISFDKFVLLNFLRDISLRPS